MNEEKSDECSNHSTLAKEEPKIMCPLIDSTEEPLSPNLEEILSPNLESPTLRKKKNLYCELFLILIIILLGATSIAEVALEGQRVKLVSCKLGVKIT